MKDFPQLANEDLKNVNGGYNAFTYWLGYTVGVIGGSIISPAACAIEISTSTCDPDPEECC